jgi:hypothetical protein
MFRHRGRSCSDKVKVFMNFKFLLIFFFFFFLKSLDLL